MTSTTVLDVGTEHGRGGGAKPPERAGAAEHRDDGPTLSLRRVVRHLRRAADAGQLGRN